MGTWYEKCTFGKVWRTGCDISGDQTMPCRAVIDSFEPDNSAWWYLSCMWETKQNKTHNVCSYKRKGQLSQIPYLVQCCKDLSLPIYSKT